MAMSGGRVTRLRLAIDSLFGVRRMAVESLGGIAANQPNRRFSSAGPTLQRHRAAGCRVVAGDAAPQQFHRHPLPLFIQKIDGSACALRPQLNGDRPTWRRPSDFDRIPMSQRGVARDWVGAAIINVKGHGDQSVGKTGEWGNADR